MAGIRQAAREVVTRRVALVVRVKGPIRREKTERLPQIAESILLLVIRRGYTTRGLSTAVLMHHAADCHG